MNVYICYDRYEKIETTLHTHTYNLIDAVLKNLTKDYNPYKQGSDDSV